jgi:flagellin
MSLESVNTNMGAMVALQSLESTQTQLAATQKQISTGFRVADSTDDGAAYAIAQSIRSTVGGLTSANQQLGNTQGLLTASQSALNDVSNLMNSMRDVLVKLAGDDTTGSARTQYQAQFTSLLANVKNDITGASYEGKSLIGNVGGTAGYGSVSVVQDGSGNQYKINSLGASAAYTSIANVASTSTLAATNLTSTLAATYLTATGMFTNQQNAIGTSLNSIGSNINYVNNQTSYNSDKIDALNSGLGSLVDADLAKESAQLTALQIRQQLGTQALSMANQAPQTLLSLFK